MSTPTDEHKNENEDEHEDKPTPQPHKARATSKAAKFGRVVVHQVRGVFGAIAMLALIATLWPLSLRGVVKFAVEVWGRTVRPAVAWVLVSRDPDRVISRFWPHRHDLHQQAYDEGSE